MQDENIKNSDILLPYGDPLRSLLQASNISDGEFREFLATKGIFIGDSSKQKSMPLLNTCILSPTEYYILKDKHHTKEDNKKKRARLIKCKPDFDILNIPSLNPIKPSDLGINQTTSYSTKNNLAFYPTGENQVSLDIEIERQNWIKDWTGIKTRHKGKIDIKYNKNTSELEVSMEHSSSETRDLENKIMKYVHDNLKNKNYLETNSEMESFSCKHFTNPNRFKFMLSFITDDNLGFLKFKSISGVDIIPEENKELVDEIKWMSNKVKKLLVNGNELHTSPYIIDAKYHDCLILFEINALYGFDYHGANGNCYITFGFPQKSKKYAEDSEFEFKITSIFLPNKYNHVSKNNISNFIIKQFEDIQKEQYAKYKS